jgi:hypothetical protein
MTLTARLDARSAVKDFHAGLANSTSLNRPKDWQAFERLARDLFARITGDVHMDLNGRSGQPQAGVDVSGVDQLSRAQIGIQCKGRDDASGWTRSRISVKELREEAAKARSFYPKLDIFVMLTTGPNDVRLRRVAAEISEQNGQDGKFEVQVHGWDWLEGRLGEHADLAIRYGLIAVANPSFYGAAIASAIAVQIGSRLATAIELMNEGRSVNDRFTMQNISKHLGFSDWRKLEAVSEGRSDMGLTELASVARSLGINEEWLLEGKKTPFFTDPDDYIGAEAQFESIQRLKPRKIIFVRMSEEDFESLVVAEVDDFRWVTFGWDHPTSSHVGGTGSRQLLEYCCLMRRLYRTHDHPRGCTLHGKHLDKADFMRLWEGEVHPGRLLGGHNDHWWIDFAELAESRVEKDSLQARELREAIRIARWVLADYQGTSKSLGWMREQLFQAGIPLNERKCAECYPLDFVLRRRLSE